MKYGAAIQSNLSERSVEIQNKNVKAFLAFLLLGTSTMPFFKQSFCIYLLLASLLLIVRQLRMSKEAFYFMFLVFAIEIYHSFYFDHYDMTGVRIGLGFLAASIFLIYYLKLDFLSLYITILYYFALISFVFFILFYADSGLVNSFANAIPDIFVKTTGQYGREIKQINPIFYNFDLNFLDLGRNNGPFWEPTVYATMLVIAQIFNYLLHKTLFNKKGIVFTIAILTTMSTTGFMAYFILLIFYFLLSDRIGRLTKLISVAGFLSLGVVLYTSLPFLSEKIANEMEKTDEAAEKYGGDSRMASATLDLLEVSERPAYILFGKGHGDERIAGPDKDVLRNCGDTALLIEWGIIYALIYISLLYYSFVQLARHYQIHWTFAIACTAILLIFGFSEVFFDLPFFYSFLFFGFIIKRYYTREESAEEFTELVVN